MSSDQKSAVIDFILKFLMAIIVATLLMASLEAWGVTDGYNFGGALFFVLFISTGAQYIKEFLK